VRVFQFTTVGTCDWTVPASLALQQIAVVSGGGGGGGGSFGGSTGGGGGGGGGGNVYASRKYNLLPEGLVITITVGAGGSAGAGATSLNGVGSSGGAGGNSKFGDDEATGGAGGAGAGIDSGGDGGAGGGIVGQSGSSRAGGTASNPSGGGGGSAINNGNYSLWASAGSTQSGYPLVGNLYYLNGLSHLADGGAGGAAGSATSDAGGTQSSAARAVTATGSGGNGGHGCPSTESPCLNTNGTAGANGAVLVSVFHQLTFGDSPEGVAYQGSNNMIPVVGRTYSFRPFYNPAPIGTGTWSVSPSLPAGLTFNTSTGYISGSPQVSQLSTGYKFTFTDSLRSISGFASIIVRRGDQTLSVSNMNLEYGQKFRVPIEQLIGTGAVLITSSNTGICPLSGSTSETITAMASSGSCVISISKPYNNSYFALSKSFTITLTKSQPTISISSNLSSPRATGTPITLTITSTRTTSGSVDVYAGDTLLTICGVNGRLTLSNSSASCIWVPRNAQSSNYALNARFVENTNFLSARSSDLAFQIYPSISLSYSNSESTFGSSNSITPTISGGTGATTSWTWSIVRTSNQQAVPGLSINSSGQISVSSSLASGEYAMTVTTTDTVGISESSNVTIKVNSATPVVALNAPSRPNYTVGQTIQLSASLPSDATGTVAFKYGTTTITSCGSSGNVSVSSGSASCTFSTSSISSGSYELTAHYSGGGSYTSAVSFIQKINLNPKAVFTYQNQTTTYKVSTSLSPSITDGTGSGVPSSWNWLVVQTSDSQTVSGISITTSGLIEVSDTVGAGTYSLDVSAVDLAGDTTTARVQLTVNKAAPTLRLSPRLITNAIVSEATAGRQIAWTVESTHRSAVNIKMFVSGSEISCTSPSIAFSNGQCWWSSSTSGTTVSAYATFAGDSNLESATSNVISNFAVNPSLTLAYSDTSTYTGIETSLSPVISGGSGAKTFTLSQYFTGDQITGITIETTTGVISVARITPAGVYRMVALVYDEVNASQMDDNISITVLEHSTPDISLSSTSASIEVDQEIQEYSINNASTPGFLFQISPSLPTGFTFDPVNGKIRGKSSTAVSSRTFTITARNMAGSDTATFTLAVTEPTLATITLSIGTTPAAKGTANTIVATLSHAGRVEFLIDGKRVPGCAPKRASTSITCNWKPSRMGSVAISARLTPTNNAIPAVVASTINVGVGRRTGTR
ncbi:MAG: hypothetical protein RLZZ364_735, partial [Actinomycetota bacterium]